ncbi:RNA polymerase sigma factor [Chitinophaga vietnamensis]|uniref:RNA polymerase sigma factor n=2 Tax=Chitinophaga vietnamensis TaxID=2593957 RepID=UPI001F01FAEE|nr:sigma-70 family RNA polymerase sigma factor [Chitinophaga vietnamensis]
MPIFTGAFIFMQQQELIPHLFRTEYRKIVAVLCKRFGIAAIETAEDIASDTFLTAAQSWALGSIPPNPAAWLHSVAKNKAVNYLRRTQHFNQQIAPALQHDSQEATEADIDLSPQNIHDSQLQMMFAICHPAIPPEAQVGLSLRILCGFGIEEISDAFLTSKDTINKRLFRAKEKLRELQLPIALPGQTEIDKRLAAVLTTIYLLFNEGYYSVSQDTTLRRELCFEAMRLCNMLVESPATNRPPVNALLSLMCFHASRFDARIGENGELILYHEQDTSRWNADLISQGSYFLHCASTGRQLSTYHLEAAIAWWYTRKEDTQDKWEHILQLYNQLLQIAYTPVAALNRTYALSRANGKSAAIAEAEKLQLTNNHFYFALLGELYAGINNQLATQHLERALALAKTNADKQVLQKKLERLQG